MKFLKMPFQLVWRIWFYVLILSTVIMMSPFLLILSSDEKYYPSFWKLIRGWSFFLIYAMGFRLKIDREQEIEPDKSYMFCANHASLLDGWVLCAMSKNPIVFVGKKELVKIPIFGFFYKRVVIMVDRNNLKSRKRVYEMAKKRLVNGTSIAIFPEGLVPSEDVVLAPFKNGAFSLAIEHQIPIVPQIYYDCKRLISWDVFKGYPGTFRVKQLKFVSTKGLTIEEKGSLKEKTFNLMYNELIKDELYMKDTNRFNNEREFKSPLS
ncbi:1-acyl-sn-glycerol-3-phosphate acyltransferase [Tenacibaculum adriaticum]|uniref:1-acyl-sn-glycerol-3-phosphate acyltransferase n=1 Tax=Tenacibaculum adriaticum TaxID=413713 RepID=A0A5S5DUT9_9FLAO|nr:lysophospholipid acyltransferase family protein [Tenacibaculum adriaticum]TYP99677.1 1-acyl-sn-glycerol-3-phosphate acyltransferase [Tenacibaculum adriaticum]